MLTGCVRAVDHFAVGTGATAASPPPPFRPIAGTLTQDSPYGSTLAHRQANARSGSRKEVESHTSMTENNENTHSIYLPLPSVDNVVYMDDEDEVESLTTLTTSTSFPICPTSHRNSQDCLEMINYVPTFEQQDNTHAQSGGFVCGMVEPMSNIRLYQTDGTSEEASGSISASARHQGKHPDTPKKKWRFPSFFSTPKDCSPRSPKLFFDSKSGKPLWNGRKDIPLRAFPGIDLEKWTGSPSAVLRGCHIEDCPFKSPEIQSQRWTQLAQSDRVGFHVVIDDNICIHIETVDGELLAFIGLVENQEQDSTIRNSVEDEKITEKTSESPFLAPFRQNRGNGERKRGISWGFVLMWPFWKKTKAPIEDEKTKGSQV